MRNLEIRQAAKQANVMLWEVAAAIGLQDSTFSRKLRYEFPAKEKNRILKIIRELEKGREAE